MQGMLQGVAGLAHMKNRSHRCASSSPILVDRLGDSAFCRAGRRLTLLCRVCPSTATPTPPGDIPRWVLSHTPDPPTDSPAHTAHDRARDKDRDDIMFQPNIHVQLMVQLGPTRALYVRSTYLDVSLYFCSPIQVSEHWRGSRVSEILCLP